MEILIRDAQPPDAMEIASVHVRSWRVGYRGLIPDAFLARLSAEERARRYSLGSSDPAEPHTIVAILEGAIVGFATVGPSRDEDVRDAGELLALYVDPSAWRTGVGRLLLTRALSDLRARGFTEAILWVLRGNVPAQSLYDADGWRHDGSSRRESPWGIEAEVVRYRRALERP
jgi:GNAT superfamily N-acetyltransferase